MMRKVIAGLLLCSLVGLEAATISRNTKDIVIPSLRPAPIPIVRPQAPILELPKENAEAPLLELPESPVVTLPGVVPVNPEAPLLELPESPIVTLPGVVPVNPEAPLLELPESPIVTLPGVVPVNPEVPLLELPESPIVTLPGVVPVNPEAPLLELPESPIVTLPGVVPVNPEAPLLELPESPVVTLPGVIPVNPVNPILELPEKQLSNLMQELKNAINNGKHAVANPGSTSSFIGTVDRIAQIFTAAQQVVDYAKENNCETLIPPLGVYQIRAYTTHNKCQSHFFQQRDEALAVLEKELPLANAYHSELFKQILICGGKQSETSQCFKELYEMNKDNTQALVKDIKKNVGLIDTNADKIKGCQAHNEKLVKEELNELLASAKQCVGEVPELITPELITPEAPVLELPETGIVTLPEKLPGPPIVTLPGEVPVNPVNPILELPEKQLSNLMQELKNAINNGQHTVANPGSTGSFIGAVDRIAQIFTAAQQVVDYAKGKNCEAVIPPLGIYQIRAYLTHSKCQTYFFQETETALSELIKLIPETKNYRSALFKQIFVCAAKQSAAPQCFEELYAMHKNFAHTQVSAISSNIGKVANLVIKIKGCQDHNEKLVKEELNELLASAKQCVSEVADEAFPEKIEQFENILTESLNLANRKILNDKALKKAEIDEVLEVAKSVITHAIENQCGGSLESYEVLEQEALTAHRKCKTYYDDKNEVAKTQLRGQALLGKFLLNKINSRVNQCANDASCLNQLTAQEGPSIDVAIQKLEFLRISVSKHQDNISGCQSHNLKVVKAKVEDLVGPLKQCYSALF